MKMKWHNTPIMLMTLSTMMYAQEFNDQLSFLNTPPPMQELITTETKIVAPPPMAVPNPHVTYSYEEIVVFALQAVIAAFHIDPQTWMDDRQGLEVYYSEAALKQLDDQLFPGTGKGICDQYIVQQISLNAIAREPAEITPINDRKWSVSLPVVLSDHRKINSTIVIQPDPQASKGMRVDHFQIQEVT